jgi:hypothetical protein
MSSIGCPVLQSIETSDSYDLLGRGLDVFNAVLAYRACRLVRRFTQRAVCTGSSCHEKRPAQECFLLTNDNRHSLDAHLEEVGP